MSEKFDTIVIGAGQAGLSAGYHLARRGLRFVILDAHERIGDSWRVRLRSLRHMAELGFRNTRSGIRRLAACDFSAPKS